MKRKKVRAILRELVTSLHEHEEERLLRRAIAEAEREKGYDPNYRTAAITKALRRLRPKGH